MKKTISVIIPVYNVEKYLSRCIESVMNQTYSNIEIILIDDGSTDSSGKICDEYEKKDERIKVIHKENGGVSSARNKGLDIAGGNYISFADSDDSMEPDMLELLMNNMKMYGVDISHCSYYREYENGMLKPPGVHGKSKLHEHRDGICQLLYGKDFEPSLCDKLFKKELFAGLRLDEEIRVNEDFLILFDLFCRAERSYYADECKYHYYERENSCSRKPFDARWFDCFTVINRIFEKARFNNLGEEIYSYCRYRKVTICFSLLNRVLFDENYKKESKEFVCCIKDNLAIILRSSLYSGVYKIAAILIAYFIPLYKMALKIFKS